MEGYAFLKHFLVRSSTATSFRVGSLNILHPGCPVSINPNRNIIPQGTGLRLELNMRMHVKDWSPSCFSCGLPGVIFWGGLGAQKEQLSASTSLSIHHFDVAYISTQWRIQVSAKLSGGELGEPVSGSSVNPH
jgi:hypothetical protein